MTPAINYDLLSRKMFRIHIKVLFSDGSEIDISNHIRKTTISNNFISYVMPKFNLDFYVPVEIVAAIQRDRDRVVFSLEIEKTPINFAEESDLDDANTRTYSPYLPLTILKPLLMTDDPLDTTSLHKSSTVEEEDGSGRNAYNFLEFSVVAVPEAALQTNKRVTSGIYRNVTVTEVLLALATKGSHKVNLVPPTNNKKYGQIILYPGNLYSNIYHLDNTYGIYDDDVKVYTIGDRILITPLNSTDVLPDKAPISMMIEFDRKNPKGNLLRGSYDELDSMTLQETKHIVLPHTKVRMRNQGNLIYEAFGSDLTMSYRDTTGLQQVETGYEKYDRNGATSKARLYEDVYGNDLSRTTFLNQIVATDMITLRVEDVDLTPTDGLRQYNLTFNNPDYADKDGSYKCLLTTHDFETSPRGYTVLTNTLTMRNV